MKKIKTTELETILKQSSREDLLEYIHTLDELNFVHEINKIINAHNYTKTQVIQKTTLDRNYAYQVLQGTRNGRKDIIIQLCVALSCDLETTNTLLKLSNNSSLYVKNKRDAIIIFGIHHHLSVMEINEMLDHQEFDPI